MTEEPEFLTLDEILEIHDDQIHHYGGDVGVRDRGLLESAVAMPRQSFGGQYLHKDIFEMAAAYAFHLAESQAFVDGNKRTGLAAAYMFLGLNGFRLVEQEPLQTARAVQSSHPRRLQKKPKILVPDLVPKPAIGLEPKRVGFRLRPGGGRRHGVRPGNRATRSHDAHDGRPGNPIWRAQPTASGRRGGRTAGRL